MKQWILVSSLLGICSALPILPQHAGIPGLGSISLETMRQMGGRNGPNALSQYAMPYSYGDLFFPPWMHNHLPPHSSFYWLRQRPQDHETQRYEYTMPVHPPPLPSQQTPTLLQRPGIPEQPHYQFTDLTPTMQAQLQQYEMQPPFQQTPLPEGNQPVVPQKKRPPLDRQTQQIYLGLHGNQQDQAQPPPQQSIFPNLYYMPYVANQGAAPGRLGIVSSEEMQGGGFGPPAYQAPGPDLFATDARLRHMALNQPGDYTVEDDQLGITEQPDVKGGANVGANPAGKGNPINPLEGNPAIGASPNANSYLLHPAGQSKGPLGEPQATGGPLAPEGLPVLDAAGTAMPLDPTTFPDTMFPTDVGNGAGLSPIGQDMWHFQEP
uniref:Ameloblastin n=1 Tax=Pogona vitticeps TaxID=103695 RepID=A0A6J0UD79_9SAUR